MIVKAEDQFKKPEVYIIIDDKKESLKKKYKFIDTVSDNKVFPGVTVHLKEQFYYFDSKTNKFKSSFIIRNISDEKDTLENNIYYRHGSDYTKLVHDKSSDVIKHIESKFEFIEDIVYDSRFGGINVKLKSGYYFSIKGSYVSKDSFQNENDILDNLPDVWFISNGISKCIYSKDIGIISVVSECKPDVLNIDSIIDYIRERKYFENCNISKDINPNIDQDDVFIEELSELIKAILKLRRKNDNTDVYYLNEEIADVMITLFGYIERNNIDKDYIRAIIDEKLKIFSDLYNITSNK